MLTLNYRDSRPIYGQIKDGLRRMIVSGALEPGEKLPSIRAMAVRSEEHTSELQSQR